MSEILGRPDLFLWFMFEKSIMAASLQKRVLSGYVNFVRAIREVVRESERYENPHWNQK